VKSKQLNIFSIKFVSCVFAASKCSSLTFLLSWSAMAYGTYLYYAVTSVS